MSATAHPQGFTFPPSSKPVSVTFASALSFVPHVPAPSTDSSEAAQTIPAGGPGGLGDLPSDVSVRYWDEQALLRCQWATGWQEGDQRELETAALARSATKKSSRHAGTPAMALATSKEPADPAAEAKGMLRRLEKDAMMPIAIKFGGGGKPAKADKAASSVFGARADDSDDEGGEGAKSTLPVKGWSGLAHVVRLFMRADLFYFFLPQASSTRCLRWRPRARWRRASASGTRPRKSSPTSRTRRPALQTRATAASSLRRPTRFSRTTTSRGPFKPYFAFPSFVLDRDRVAALASTLTRNAHLYAWT